MKKHAADASKGPGIGTWFSDPAHFRRPSRRDFLYVGAIGGLGLTLGDYLNLQSQASAATGRMRIVGPPPFRG